MTTFATDTFASGGRGSPNAWSPGSDSNNWTQSRGNQTLSIVSSQGVLTYNGSTTTGVMTYAGLTETDTEVLVNGVQGTSNSDIIGAVCRFSNSSNFYAAVIGNTATTFEIRKVVSGTFSTVASGSFTSSFGTKYTIRFNITGTTLKGKIWASSGSEPGSWTATGTDSNIASGLFGVAGTPVGSSNVKFDTFSATNGATGATHFFICDGFGGVFS